MVGMVRLPKPVGKQREVVTMTTTGHVVVLGTAGSGKTTMAVHRAAYLGSAAAEHGGRTLLVTFNRALLAYFNHLGARDLPNVDVANYHQFARGYLNSLGLMDATAILRASQPVLKAAWLEASADASYSRQARLPFEFLKKEIAYLQQHGLLSRSDYKSADRTGRLTPLDAASREFVFDVFERYRARRAAQGFRYDWDELAYHARIAAEADTRARRYTHVVIDEGQDFSPEMIRSLAASIPQEGSLTFFGDVAQQIYGRAVSFRSAGLQVGGGRIARFEQNYRNTPEIAALGLAIADMPYYRDQPDMVAPKGFVASGPKPTLVRFDDWGAQNAFVTEQVRRVADTQSVAILVRRNADEELFTDAFPDAHRLDRDLATWSDGPGVSIGTVHGAKGFEFDTVFVVGVSNECWPDPVAVQADGPSDAEATDGRLLYVAVTRARQNLVVTVPGEPSELLPMDKELWTSLKR